MAVFRVERNKGYTVMSNHHLRNKELSLPASYACYECFYPLGSYPLLRRINNFAKLTQKKNAAIFKKRLQRSLNLIQF